MEQPRILIIDDDHDVLITARMFLEQLEFNVSVLSDPEKIVSIVQKTAFDVILLDMNFQRGKTEGTEGIRWLETIRKLDKRVVVILMTAFGDVELAVRAVFKSRGLRAPRKPRKRHNYRPHGKPGRPVQV